MKTSNKILTGFLVVIFIIPFLAASVLKKKIEKGEYKVVKTENRNALNVISGPLDTVRVLDIAASDPGLLHCKLIPADSMKYSYERYSATDTLTIYQKNDTLFIRHPSIMAKADKSKLYYLHVNVFLPRFDNLKVDGASVFIDTLPNPSGTFTVTLKNGGTVSGDRE